MAIKKSKVHVHNGTDFDVIHYETQAEKVKILDKDGNVDSNLEEMFLNGKILKSIDAKTISNNGIYKVFECTGLPEHNTTETYILEVTTINDESGKKITNQKFVDHINNDTYNRVVVDGVSSDWSNVGKTMDNKISTIVKDVANLDSLMALYRSATDNLDKSVIDNSLNVGVNKDEINALKTTVESDYLKKIGGNVTGSISLSNNVGMLGKDVSGTSHSIGKVNASNQVEIGSSNLDTIIKAKGNNVKINNGASTVTVFHTGNMGHGSGLDADKVDGIEGSLFARRDTANTFTSQQTIANSNNMVFKASSGSSNAGKIVWQDGNGSQKGKIDVDSGGNIVFYVNSSNAMTVKSNGMISSGYGSEFDSTSRETRRAFYRSGDSGIGHYMGTTGTFGLYDWQYDTMPYSVNRASGVMQFANHISIQGKKLFIQTSAPSGGSNGDVWIDI